MDISVKFLYKKDKCFNKRLRQLDKTISQIRFNISFESFQLNRSQVVHWLIRWLLI